ncbi:MAG TPA: MauE/DoxX family redox-associated membrane protein [Steroidobacteraceae bacterium]|nr:MauE/DoxX family redox-associated membrane protein [Steroidobacteraceae bacterium]
MMLDPVVGLLMVTTIALLFGSAAVHKLRDLRRFDEIFAAYEILPAGAGRILGRGIPVLELLVALGLLSEASRPYAAVAGVLLLLTYAAAIGVNLRRGRRDLSCGCGGPNDRRPIAPWMVGRNVVIALILAGSALLPWTGRPLGITDVVTLTFGLLTLALIYLCIDQLMDYARRVAQLRGLR